MTYLARKAAVARLLLLALAAGIVGTVPWPTTASRAQAAQQGYLGAGIQDIEGDEAERLGLARGPAVLVQSVNPQGPAERAGLQAGDVIVAVDGVAVSSGEQAVAIISSKPPGTTIPFALIRNGGRQTLNVTLASRPSEQEFARRRAAEPTTAGGEATAAPSRASPEETWADERCSFEYSAQQHETELADLGRTRSGASHLRIDRLVPPEAQEGAPRIEDVTRWLGERIDQGSYPADTYVLFYSARPERVCSWLINRGGVVATGLTDGNASFFEGRIWDLMSALDVHERQIPRTARRLRGDEAPAPAPPRAAAGESSGPNALDDALSSISRFLFPEPVAKALGSVKHLVVVPTGSIGTLPFSALVPVRGEPPIVERFSVSIAPSLHSLAAKVDPWRPGSAFARPLVFGNPLLPASQAWSVPALPGAEAEAKEVASRLNTRALIGPEATKDAMLRSAGSASLLWVATHGIADDRDGVKGGFLMMSAPTLEAGFWTAKEIQSSRLRADLAVLSACQTGLGQSHAAGMIGLSRAFQLAGVPRVLMSLWNVDDEATGELMKRFVQHAGRHPPAEALRQSMLEVRQSYPHPTLWASFLLFGEAS
jgi:hypothetical protein